MCNKWMDISTAPKDIKAIVSDGKYVIEAYNHWGYWTYGEDQELMPFPTHYMSLPQPPEDE